MGYSVRTLGWRYTEWRAFDPSMGVVRGWETDAPIAIELYQHQDELAAGGDAGAQVSLGNGSCSWTYEHQNVASDPANAQQIRRLKALLCHGQAPESCPRSRAR